MAASSQGKKWFHKGKIEQLFDPENVPDGWKPGRVGFQSSKNIEKKKDVELRQIKRPVRKS